MWIKIKDTENEIIHYKTFGPYAAKITEYSDKITVAVFIHFENLYKDIHCSEYATTIPLHNIMCDTQDFIMVLLKKLVGSINIDVKDPMDYKCVLEDI